MTTFQEHQDEPSIKRMRRRLSRGVFVVPSVLTACALFSGFYSIIYTVTALVEKSGDFKPAVFAVILATFFDSLDGRIARLMKAETSFGFEFDSIADMVSFGVAPAVLVYGGSLVHMGDFGWLGAFAFLACAGIRLARFNVLSATQASKKYFKGMSSPVAAGGLSVSLLMANEYLIEDIARPLMLCVTIFLALLMVSNIRFRSFKEINWGRRRPFLMFLIVMGIIVFLVSFKERALFAFFITYLIFGLLEELFLFRRRRKSDPSVPLVPFGDRDDMSQP